MSKLIAALLLSIATSCTAQTGDFNSEFKTYNNGLIYDPVTMNQLTHIVDSLNIKFKRCDLNRNYHALSQGIGIHVYIEGKRLKNALKDIENNISFNAFANKYGEAKTDSPMLIVKTRFIDSYSQKWNVQFSGETMIDYGDHVIRIKDDSSYYSKPLLGKWILNEYADKSLEAFFITEEFKSVKIPEKYARMILYADCVVDTTTDIFVEKSSAGDQFYSRYSDKNYKKTKLFAFNNYIAKNTEQITEKDVPAIYKDDKWEALDSMKKAWVSYKLAPTEEFKLLFAEAVKEVKEKNMATDNEFEAYVARYISKADALEMKRNRRVMGMCSMDQSPRYHALNIAMLSAETVNWQLFLRAHLNIMNDRFDRASDGSWAWSARKTYIKELEELNIEVQELLLGICLRIENPADKHYFGSIGRLGRALAETKNRIQLEDQLLTSIKDTELDVYNRMLMHYLFLNYIYNLPEKDARMAGLAKLEDADKTLPAYIRNRIKINRKNFEKTE